MAQVAIKVEHVSKVYKLYDKSSQRLRESLGLTRKKLHTEHYALQDLSFNVAEGETVGIIGTNGSGKSTILKIITGVLSPTGGTVKVNGRISALLELGAGFNMEYTGIENIYLNGTMMGFSREEIDGKMEAILEFADIGEFVYQPVKTYSSGMFVRLAFAVAINIEPEVLIVDEALSVGDVFFQNKCYHKFEEFKKMGKTILFVSHDLNSISRYCDRVILLNKGEKLAEGIPKEMVDLYKKVLVRQNDKQYHKKAGGESDRQWKESMTINPQKDEYGSGKAEMEDFAILDSEGNYTNIVEKGSEFTIKVKAKFYQRLEYPIIAFAIKDIHGTTITGTNTMYENINTGCPEAGESFELSFRQQMDLQGGEYLLSLGCTGYENGELTVYHRLYDVCSITVVADKVADGFYDMNSQVEIRYYRK